MVGSSPPSASSSRGSDGKHTSWLSRSKSNAKAKLQGLGQGSSSQTSSSSYGATGVVGAATSKLNRVVSRDMGKREGTEKDGKGRERESAVAEQHETVAVDEKVRRAVGESPKSPRVILGAVPDNWQMYRFVDRSSSAFVLELRS